MSAGHTRAGHRAWGRGRPEDPAGTGRCAWLTRRPVSAGPEEAPGRQVDLVSASVVVVGVIAALLIGLLVVVVLLMARYHRRKTQQMTQK